MAVTDTAVLKIDSGNYFVATTGASVPADLGAPTAAPATWEAIGHTSLENILGSESEGGEATVLGTLQKKVLRTSYSPRTDSFTITLQQFDEDSLKLYFGSNMVDVNSDGSLMGAPITPTPTEKAFLALYWDGSNVFGIYCPKVEIVRADNWSLENTEGLSGLPLKITPVVHNSNTWATGLIPITAYVAPSS